MRSELLDDKLDGPKTLKSQVNLLGNLDITILGEKVRGVSPRLQVRHRELHGPLTGGGVLPRNGVSALLIVFRAIGVGK